jgi:hypothetical protein
MQGVAMHQTTVVADEGKDAIEAAGLENRPGFACANQLKDLKIFSKIFFRLPIPIKGAKKE